MNDTSQQAKQPQREREQQLNAGAGWIIIGVLLAGFGAWAVIHSGAGILLPLAAVVCLVRGVKSIRAARRNGGQAGV